MTIRSIAVLCSIGVIAIVGCKDDSHDRRPTLAETTAWMGQSLLEHNGQRLEVSGQLNKLRADGCHLTYETFPHDTIEVDLSDIDSRTIATKRSGLPRGWYSTHGTIIDLFTPVMAPNRKKIRFLTILLKVAAFR
jgi:hypothetical protein